MVPPVPALVAQNIGCYNECALLPIAKAGVSALYVGQEIIAPPMRHSKNDVAPYQMACLLVKQFNKDLLFAFRLSQSDSPKKVGEVQLDA
jgi:hypothetical protein